MNKNCVVDLMKQIYPGQEISDKAVDKFLELIKELSDKEEAVLNLRYGLTDGVKVSIDEVADTYEVSRERIEEVLSVAFKKLRHPTRSNNLFED